MPSLPPLGLVLGIVVQGIFLPFAVATAIVLTLCRTVPFIGRWMGGALALAAAFLAGNYFRGAVVFRLQHNRPLDWSLLAQKAWDTFKGSVDPEAPLPADYYWLPWVVLLGFAAELFVRHRLVPRIVALFVRAAVVIVASRLLVSPELRGESPWLWPALAAACLANWWLLDIADRDGPPGWLPLGFAGLWFAAATVLIHAHTARFTDVGTILAGAWLGIALSAYWGKSNPGGATPATAIGLPGLMLVAQQNTFSDLPIAAFALVALAPLTFLIVRRWPTGGLRFAILGWILLLVPAALAVLLAVRYESLSF